MGASWIEENDAEYQQALLEVVPFGEFKGHTVGYVLKHRPVMLEWLLGKSYKPSLRKALRVVLEKHGESIREAEGRKAAMERWARR